MRDRQFSQNYINLILGTKFKQWFLLEEKNYLLYFTFKCIDLLLDCVLKFYL